MASRNAYLKYKYETNRIIYWIVQKSNEIIKCLDHASLRALINDDNVMVPRGPNLSGQVTVTGLVTLAKLIGRHDTVKKTPAAILHLFSSVIEARTASHAIFQQVAARSPDPNLIRSNESHRLFIEALKVAFEELGGEEALQASTGTPAGSNTAAAAQNNMNSVETKDDMDQLLFANKFGALDLQGGDQDDVDDAESEDEAAATPDTTTIHPARRQQAKPGRGKKGAKRPKSTKPDGPKMDVSALPLESYRIIQEDDGNNFMDYIMAVSDIIQQMAILRSKMQRVWSEVVRDGLNAAVAGALSHIAVGMVQRTVTAIFVDFPGHDSFEAIVNALTCGDVEGSQGKFWVSLYRPPTTGSGDDPPLGFGFFLSEYSNGLPPSVAGAGTVNSPLPRPPAGVTQTYIDVKEQFLIHAYNDLLDFVLDFQKNRNGKPTKKMSAEIKDWDYPRFNLERATNAERIQWRRSYTINWLYDLVNVYSYPVVMQRNTNQKKEEGGRTPCSSVPPLEEVDWSSPPTGPQGATHRTVFGLQEFAAFMTSLAMQKPGTDIRKRIQPHHVFQLQLIVDSLAVSRGWSVSALHGHMIVPPHRGFRTRQDLDIFLDRERKREHRGFLPGAETLEDLLQEDDDLQAELHINPTFLTNRSSSEIKRGQWPGANNEEIISMIRLMRVNFADWLGQSKCYVNGMDGIPPSRFSKTSSNGLWDYSPMLCGTGLAEGLLLAHQLGQWVWDRIPEVIYVVHLHNMLHKRGFIRSPVGLFVSLERFFPETFFEGGKIPDSNFDRELGRVMESHPQLKTTTPSIGTTRPHRVHHQQQRQRAAVQQLQQQLLDGQLLNMHKTRFSRAESKSDLFLYSQAKWDPDRISDDDLPIGSAISNLRLSNTPRVMDPNTGSNKLQDSVLVRRAEENNRRQGLPPGTWQDNLAQGGGLELSPAGRKMARMLEGLREETEVDRQRTNINTASSSSSGQRVGGGGGGMSLRKPMVVEGLEVTDDLLLDMLKADILSDVCGMRMFSGLNLMWAAARLKMIFLRIEAAMGDPKSKGYKVYLKSFLSQPRRQTGSLSANSPAELGNSGNSMFHKRFRLAVNACRTEDVEALKLMAGVFLDPRAGYLNHVYWDGLVEDFELETTKARREQEETLSEEMNMACCVM